MPAEFALLTAPMIRPKDKWASAGGAYQAARATDGRSRKHEGIDLLTVPGQPIVAPTLVRVLRRADPYPDSKDSTLSGIVLEAMGAGHDGLRIKILYLDPDGSLIGKLIPRGTVIGHAQSLQELYPGIRDHIHVEHEVGEMRVDPTPYYIDSGLAPAGGTVTA